MSAYIEKIDYIHTRLSVPLSPDFSAGGFISNTLKKIQDEESYEPAKNNQIYDIVSSADVSEAYYLIGLYGKNKADYFIGSGIPTKLNDFFENFRLANLGMPVEKKNYTSDGKLSFFNTHELFEDTGFVAKNKEFNLMGVN